MSPQARVLILSTTAFTLLFAVWLMFGILGKPIRQEFALSATQVYWLGAAAVLAGSLFRLPFGILADRIGGRVVLTGLLLWTAVPCALVGWAADYQQLFILALLFGIAGNAFSVGIAWNSAWFDQKTQGAALGTFGAGNVGASVTKLAGPLMIAALPAAGLFGGLIPGGWRGIPVCYAALLVAMAGILWFATPSPDRRPGKGRSIANMLAPLAEIRVWRFGLYYIVVFGAYVAMSLWLPMYYQEVYGSTLVMSGLLTALFIFPASLLRPLGGWMSDRWGARPVTYAVFAALLALCVPLSFNGYRGQTLPIAWFTALVVLVGIGMGIGKASVYRYIPDYFPKDVGAVGGLVGTLGALGGFVMMPLFGVVESYGIRQSAFVLLGGLVAVSLCWLHLVVLAIRKRETALVPAIRDMEPA